MVVVLVCSSSNNAACLLFSVLILSSRHASDTCCGDLLEFLLWRPAHPLFPAVEGPPVRVKQCSLCWWRVVLSCWFVQPFFQCFFCQRRRHGQRCRYLTIGTTLAFSCITSSRNSYHHAFSWKAGHHLLPLFLFFHNEIVEALLCERVMQTLNPYCFIVVQYIVQNLVPRTWCEKDSSSERQ